MTEELADVPFDSPPAVKSSLPLNGTHAPESFENAAVVPDPKARLWKKTDSPARTLPHSLEAEMGLLSSVFVDPEKVMPLAIESGIAQSSFYDPFNGLVFRTLLSLHAANIPIDPVIAAEELKKANLVGVNVYARITEVSEATATTAQAPYFIERVREHALLRDVIRTASSTVEEAYQVRTDIPTFIAQAEERLRWSERSTTARTVLERLELSRYCAERRLPDVEPVFFLGKTPISTRGNLTTLTAQSKTGKSSFLAGMLASTFRDPDHGGDTFTVLSTNPDQKAVIHFDTEQHGKHHERMMDMVCRRAGADLPPWLHSYARKGSSATQLRTELEVVLKSKHRTHRGIHSVHLDGVADFAADVNDPKECNPLVSWLESLAVTYDCAILCVLHLNPVANKDFVAKSRGHLGSQLQRKVETDIRLKKEENDVTVVFTDPAGTRGPPVFEKDGPRFSWDQEAGMHTSCSSARSSRDDAKTEHLREIAADVFDHAKSSRLRYADFLRSIEAVAQISTKRAEARFSEIKKAGILTKDLMGFWCIAHPEK